jgi:molybdopterin molybdotransferase
VAKQPKVIIISTGDELVDIGEQPLPHQIRKSNVERIKSHLRAYSIHAADDHLPDDKEIMYKKLKAYLLEFDVIILSGGVSMGKFDFVPEILTSLGVEKLFHKVKQRPGKPFWFGKSKSSVVFALPGNPNSSFVCTVRYLIPWLVQSSGLKYTAPSVRLTEDVVFEKPLTRFLSVKINTSKLGVLEAKPIFGHGSGDFASLTEATGFLELPEEMDHFKCGEVFKYFPFR